MKWLLITSALIVFSCTDKASQTLSADQQGLYNLSRDFNKDYKDTSDSRARETLVSQYQLKLQDYLKHSCSSRLENMRVQMTKFEEDADGSVYARFVDDKYEYVFHKVYDSSAQMKADTIYKLVKSFQLDTDITVRFLFAGNVDTRESRETFLNGFQIEVVPTERVS